MTYMLSEEEFKAIKGASLDFQSKLDAEVKKQVQAKVKELFEHITQTLKSFGGNPVEWWKNPSLRDFINAVRSDCDKVLDAKETK